MKYRLHTLLQDKIQWLVLLTALLGMSQGAWATDYPANKRFYVKYSSHVSTLNMYCWKGDTNNKWPGSTLNYIGKIGEDHYYYGSCSFDFEKYIISESGSSQGNDMDVASTTYNLFQKATSNTSNFAPSGSEGCGGSAIKVHLNNPGNDYQSVGWNSSGGAYLYAYNGGTKILGDWPGTYVTSSNNQYSYTFNNDANYDNITVIFRSEHNHGGNLGKTGNLTLDKGYEYTFHLTGSYSGDGENRVFATSQDSKTSIPATSSEPFVALDNANASSVSGTSVTLYGYVALRGCAELTSYGFQYNTSKSESGATTVTTSGDHAIGSYNNTFTVSTSGDYYYRAVAANAKGTVYSDWSTETFTISCTKPVAPTSDAATSKVTTSDVLCEGKSITLTAPTGFTGSPTSYVWNINGSDDDTQTGSTYTYTVPSSSFTAKVKGVNACGTSDNYSYETTFSSIIAKPTTTYNVGGGGTICSTGSTSITLDGSQSGFKYQLYKGDDPVEGKVIDGGGGELSFTGISASGTYYVYAYKSGSASCSFKMNGSTSSSASVTVVDPAAITSISSSSTECEGDSKVLSVTGNACTTGYQWYKDGNTISGATSNSYTVSEISETASYTCLPFNETCSWGALSDEATITMAPKPIGTTISGPATACKGQTSLSYTASSDAVAGSTYSYSWSVESGGWTLTSSATANPATFTAGTGASGTIGVTPTLTTSGKACAGSKVTKTVSTPNKTVTIKVEKKGVAASTAPYVYVWTEGIDTWSDAWPGNEMIDDPYNAGWWTADISVGRCIYQLIFSSGSTQTPNSEQITSDEKCFSFSANSWSDNKPEDNYADCPIACTPPTTQIVTASKAATCKNSSEYVTVASSQVGYTYELYYRISPADYASTGNTVEGTGSALKISTGKLTSTGTYDLQVKAFDTTTGGCVTVMNVSAAQITTSSVAGPALSISSASAKNFESVTVSSDVAATWAVSNKETVGGVDDSYISPTGTAANETTVFKGTVGSSSSSKDFLVTATSVAQSSCTSTLVVNVSKDAESCE